MYAKLTREIVNPLNNKPICFSLLLLHQPFPLNSMMRSEAKSFISVRQEKVGESCEKGPSADVCWVDGTNSGEIFILLMAKIFHRSFSRVPFTEIFSKREGLRRESFQHLDIEGFLEEEKHQQVQVEKFVYFINERKWSMKMKVWK